MHFRGHRVERIHGVHQDRLIKKLRRKGIHRYDAANEFLEKEYLPQHNRRFARVPAKPEDYHGRKPRARELGQIFRLESERRISNDWVIRHEGRYLQLQPAGQRRYGPTKCKALVCEWEDGRLEVLYRGDVIAHEQITELPTPRQEEQKDATNTVRPVRRSGPRWNGQVERVPWATPAADGVATSDSSTAKNP